MNLWPYLRSYSRTPLQNLPLVWSLINRDTLITSTQPNASIGIVTGSELALPKLGTLMKGHLATHTHTHRLLLQFQTMLASFSEPSLLVKAASLKQTMHTAFNLTTLSASGIRFNTGPNGYHQVKGLIKYQQESTVYSLVSGMFHPMLPQSQSCPCWPFLHRTRQYLETEDRTISVTGG